jgi:hypothetical protein
MGGHGTGPGAFDLPGDVAVDGSGNIYVTDTHRVQIFGPDRTFLSAWVAPGTADNDYLSNIAIASDGSVYVSATGKNVIYKLGVAQQAPTASTEAIADSTAGPVATPVTKTPAPPAAPSASVNVATTALVIDHTFPVHTTLDLPPAWSLSELTRGGFGVRRTGGTNEWPAYVDASIVSNAFADPCHAAEGPMSPPVGPSVDDLTAALTHLAGFRAGPVTDITVDGFHGKSFDLTNSIDIKTCSDDPWLRQWTADDSVSGDVHDVPNGSLPGSHQRIAIIDVNGTRLLIEQWTFSSTSLSEILEAQAVFDSIRFQ